MILHIQPARRARMGCAPSARTFFEARVLPWTRQCHIVLLNGNSFDTDVNAIVSPVNTKGVMGAGLALQVKQRHTGVFKAYADACAAGEVDIGSQSRSS
jgi:hypothetical protein